MLRGEASTASIFPNSTDIGVSREKIYGNILKLHLPSSTNVLYGGFLFGLNGDESSQIDVIVTINTSLQFNFHNQTGEGKSFACIDGCAGIVSIKSNLTSAELKDALANIASIPDKQPIEGRVNPLYQFSGYNDWPYKIIFASDGISWEKCLEVLNEYYIANPNIPSHKRPNLIHVAGKYVVFRLLSDEKFPDGRLGNVGQYWAWNKNTDTLGLLTATLNLQDVADNSKQVIFKYSELLDKVMSHLL